MGTAVVQIVAFAAIAVFMISGGACSRDAGSRITTECRTARAHAAVTASTMGTAVVYIVAFAAIAIFMISGGTCSRDAGSRITAECGAAGAHIDITACIMGTAVVHIIFFATAVVDMLAGTARNTAFGCTNLRRLAHLHILPPPVDACEMQIGFTFR